MTGLLYVDLEFLPGTPVVYRQPEKRYPEIPTAPVDVQVLRMDVSGIAAKLDSILARLNASLGELSMTGINHGITNLLISLNALARAPDLTNGLASVQVTLEEFRTLSAKLRSSVDTLGDTAERTLIEFRQTLSEMRGGVQDLRDLLAPRAPLRREVSEVLEQLTGASRAVGALAEYLRQHLNALLSGKKTSEAKP